ncbi:MAG: hypothetical protein ACSW8I_08115 [bacterium]
MANDEELYTVTVVSAGMAIWNIHSGGQALSVNLVTKLTTLNVDYVS